MRILHIANHIGEKGNGIVNVLIDLACKQSEMGHEVHVASKGGEYESLLNRFNVRHHLLDQSRKPKNLILGLFTFQRLMKEIKPDIVHAHMMTGALLAKFCRALNDYKIVTHVHNEFQKSANIMGVGDRVIAVSKAVAESMEGRGIKKEKLRVVLNGTIGSPRTYSAQDVNLEGNPKIVTVAGLYERKGIHDVIDAFEVVVRNFPNAMLYIVGDGPDRQKFEEKARNKAYRDLIQFKGFQSNSSTYMRKADIFVLASHKDPCPLVLIEAKEAGCAIVATNVDGIPETLNYGTTGILVPPRDPKALGNAIVDLLLDEGKRNDLKYRSTQGLEYYQTQRVTEETMKIYQEIFAH